MDITIRDIDENKLAIIYSPNLTIKDEQDALDLMANASYLGARAINLPAEYLKVNSSLLRRFHDTRANQRESRRRAGCTGII